MGKAKRQGFDVLKMLGIGSTGSSSSSSSGSSGRKSKKQTSRKVHDSKGKQSHGRGKKF